MNYKIFKIDPYLKPFAKDIELRMDNFAKKKNELLGESASLCDFANGYNFFGVHKT
ncbi:MAG: hypothetical protein IIX89_03735 [Oscillospiraceae bacterium]|nr:hypothetical protein [Oscillospiraceae bacterium]